MFPSGRFSGRQFLGKWIFFFFLIIKRKYLAISNFFFNVYYTTFDFHIGIQVNPSAPEKQVRVDADTKLHITNVVVDVGNFPHQG